MIIGSVNDLKLNIKDKKINDPTLYIKYAKKSHLCIDPEIKYHDESICWYDFLNINIIYNFKLKKY